MASVLGGARLRPGNRGAIRKAKGKGNCISRIPNASTAKIKNRSKARAYKEESDALLMELYAHQSQPEFVYAHCWQPGMLVMWDNRSGLHGATGGYDGYDRLLHRTTISDTQF